MPIHAPKILVFGVWTPKRDWSSSRPPKGTSWPDPRLHGDFGRNRSSGATWARTEETKKARKESYSGKLGVRPDHPRWRSDMWSCMLGWSLGDTCSSKFQVLSKSVERFGRYLGGVEFRHFLYLRPVAYITACRDVGLLKMRVQLHIQPSVFTLLTY